MNYSNLIAITFKAQQNKPKFSNLCNNCGWCCLTEVCVVGEGLGAKELPCKFLISNGDKHTCSLAEYEEVRKQLAIGVGCDAKTQSEQLEEIKVK